MEINIKGFEKKYTVYINETPSIDDFTQRLMSFHSISPFDKIFIITDDNLNNIYMNPLSEDDSFNITDALWQMGFNVIHYVVPSGENSKTIETVSEIYSILEVNEFSKSDLIIGFGGGVVGDLSAFVSSTFKRGTKFINVPTSLLAMIDSCIGSKTGINSKDTKNIIGSYKDPEFVYINTSFIKTLSQRGIQSSFGELFKYFLISSSFIVYKQKDKLISAINDFSKLIQNDNLYYPYIIQRCLEIKKYFVESDPFDENIRQFLNLGHSFGHIIEKQSQESLPHGICVAIGIDIISKISNKLGFINTQTLKKVEQIVSTITNDVSYSIDNTFILKLKNDKKFSNDFIHLLLLSDESGVVRRKVHIDDILNILTEL